jgi:hypothetical protein
MPERDRSRRGLVGECPGGTAIAHVEAHTVQRAENVDCLHLAALKRLLRMAAPILDREQPHAGPRDEDRAPPHVEGTVAADRDFVERGDPHGGHLQRR